MAARRRGASAGHYLALLLFGGLLVGFFYWKNQHGVIGGVQPFPTSTKDFICFVKREGRAANLYVIQSDGTGLRQLTNDASSKRQPAFSPDGNQIVYVASTSSEGVTTYQVFLIGQGAPRQATTGSLAKDTPTFSPDGKRIAFLTGGAVKVMNTNATGLDQIFPPPHRGHAKGEGEEGDDHNAAKLPPVTEYRWSPLGTSIAGILANEGDAAMVSGEGNWWLKDKPNEPKQDSSVNVLDPESIFFLPLDSEKPNVIMSGNRTGFAWMPDGKSLLVTVTSRGDTHGMALLRVDEKGLPAIGRFASQGNIATAEHPAISPDGRRIAFELWQIDKVENRKLVGIVTVSATDGDPVLIRTPSDIAKVKMTVKGAAHQPQWSPDGTRLLYWMDGAKAREYYVAAADGSNPKKLLPEGVDGFDAVWSPAK